MQKNDPNGFLVFLVGLLGFALLNERTRRLELEDDAAWLCNRLAQLNRHIGGLQREIGMLRQRGWESQQLIAELRRALAERNAAIGQLASPEPPSGPIGFLPAY